MKNFVNCMSYDMVNGFVFVSYMMAYHSPDNIVHLLGRQLIEDTVGASQNIIKFLASIFLETDLGITDHYVRVTTKLRLFSFEVAKGSADRESSRKHSVRSNQRIIHCIFIIWRFVNSNLLETWLSLSINYRMSLVDMTSCLLNPCKLCLLTWLMIITKVDGQSSIVFGANGATIANVHNVHVIVKGHNKVCAATRLTALKFLSRLIFSIHFRDIVMVCNLASFCN